MKPRGKAKGRELGLALCLLGDKTVRSTSNTFVFRILKTGLIMCAQVILRCWREPQMWIVHMMEMTTCEKILERLNWKNDVVSEEWDSFS